MLRVPVITANGIPLMPTKASRARRWIKEGKAVGKFNKTGQFYIQLLKKPSDTNTQPIALGLDPGKHYSGIGVQSAKATLWTGHLILPFKHIRERMNNRRMMRLGRRGRRINRNQSYNLRAHRQERFSNRKKRKLPPSIRANRQLELRVIKELCRIYPVSDIYFEYVKADVDLTSGRKGARSGKGFSAVMVGQKYMIDWLRHLAPVHLIYGWETSTLRKHLRLEKTKDKSLQQPCSHAVDGVALAAHRFLKYESFHSASSHGHEWVGGVDITPSTFSIIKRPPVSRRQLHLMLPAKGGLRRKYGGTVTRHGLRKGDYVIAEKAGKRYCGWVSGDTSRQISISNFNWKRLGQFTASKVTLIQRATGLICQQEITSVGTILFC